MTADLLACLGLFLAAFAAATLLPAQSEAALVGLILLGDIPVWLLVAVASLGNVLGSTVNWALGRSLARFRDRRWFPVPRPALARAEGWFRRWGKWSLLASWVPIVGDPITLAAGALREPLATFLPIIALAKTGRYVVLALVAQGWA